MATEIKKIIDVDSSSLSDYKTRLDELRTALGELDKDSQEYVNTQRELEETADALSSALESNTSTAETLSTSYKSLEKQLSSLQDTYKSLTEEEKNSPYGQEMAKQIGSLQTQMKGLDKSMGDNTKNVGEYGTQFATAFTKMGGASSTLTGGIGKVNGAMKMLMANPIVAAIAAIVVVFMKLYDAIKGSERLTNQLNQAMSAFKPIMDIISNGMSFLAEGIVKGFQMISDTVVKTMDWLGKLARKMKLNAVADMLDGIAAAQAVANAEERESQALQQKRRDIQVQNAKLEMESAELRAKMAEKDKYTEEQRLKWAQQWQEKQKQIAKNNLEIAERELALLQSQASHTENSADVNDKLADAQAKVYQVQQRYNEVLRTTNKEISSLNIALAKKADNLSDVADQTTRVLETTQLLDDYLKEEKLTEDRVTGALSRNLEMLDQQREQDLFYANLEIQDEKEKQERIYEIRRQSYEQGIEFIQKTLDENYLSFEQRERLEQQLADKKWELEKLNATHHAQSENTQTKTSKEQVALRLTTASSYMNAMAGLMGNLADLAEEGSEEQKALQIMSTTISTLSGIVSAISGAMQLGPIAGPIVGAINSAAVLAAGITNIAKMKATTKTNNDNLGGATGASFSGVSATPLLNEARDLQSLQTIPVTQESERQDLRVYVVESDISRAQEGIKTKVTESSF